MSYQRRVFLHMSVVEQRGICAEEDDGPESAFNQATQDRPGQCGQCSFIMFFPRMISYSIRIPCYRSFFMLGLTRRMPSARARVCCTAVRPLDLTTMRRSGIEVELYIRTHTFMIADTWPIYKARSIWVTCHL